jgi:nucleolar pre-ribosomal-associated protein 1
LFQEDPHESDLWLKALPAIRLLTDEEVHDGGPLVDEADAVISFFDDCVQRCLKTPYRYLEEIRSLAQKTLTSNPEFEHEYQLQIYPSALLMTIVEQLDAKVANKLLIPSHVLGITSFIRISCFIYQVNNWIYNSYMQLQEELMRFYARKGCCFKAFRSFRVLFDVRLGCS